MIMFLKIGVSLVPVFLFLLTLILMDSFKLTRWPAVLMLLLWGGCAALGSLILNSQLSQTLPVTEVSYIRYISPVVEEFCKGLIFVYLFTSRKIGFLVDAAIYGFAAGAGFAFLENLYYLNMLQNPNFLIWVIRGLGTAVMHGGSTAFLAVLTKTLTDRGVKNPLLYFPPGFLTAIVIHSFFNHFLLPPVIMTLMQLIILPALFTVVYMKSEHLLREWLEIGLDVDVWLLEEILAGRFEDTKYGKYLNTLKQKFPATVVADMLCYLQLHLELAVRAKGLLLMREAGFSPEEDAEIKEKLAEMRYLVHHIGKTGQIALAPLLQTSTQELWQLSQVKK